MNETDLTPAGELKVMGELVLLAAIWGGSFLLMRVAAPAFGPAPLVELRLLFGALVLSPFLWRARSALRDRWPALIGIGVINAAVPFMLFAWAALQAPAGISAIANSMTALFTVLIAWWMFGERIGPRRGAGLISGLAGVVVLVGMPAAGASVGMAAVAATGAALCYAVGVNLVRRYLSGLPPVAVGAATLACSAVLVAPLAAWHWPSAGVPPEAWGSAILLGVLCTGIAYAFLFRLLNRVGPSRTATVTYLIPLFGVAWAWAVLGEPLTPVMLVAGVLILGGVGLSQSRAPKPRVPVEGACTTSPPTGERRVSVQNGPESEIVERAGRGGGVIDAATRDPRC